MPRRDGRRCLHYGLVALGMLLLNQRTWDHHSGIALLASVSIWQGISHGRLRGGSRRAWALGLTLLAGAAVWLTGTDVFVLAARLAGRDHATGQLWADYVKAWGPTFAHYVLLLIAAVLLCRRLRDADEPYALQRQKLRT